MANIRAKFVATLVYCDAPQLVVLQSGKMMLVAVAIPSGVSNEFIATSVTPSNLQLYLDEEVDLRFLFTYPQKRSTFRGVIDEITAPSIFTKLGSGLIAYSQKMTMTAMAIADMKTSAHLS